MAERIVEDFQFDFFVLEFSGIEPNVIEKRQPLQDFWETLSAAGSNNTIEKLRELFE